MGDENQKTIVVNIVKKLLKSIEVPGNEGRQMFLSTLAPRGQAVHTRKMMPNPRDGVPITYEDLPDGLAARIPWDGDEKMVEGLDGEPTVLLDHDVAVVWVPYWFTHNGLFSHVGTNIMTLINRDWFGNGKEEWLVVSSVDNARPPSDEDKKKHEARSRLAS